LTVAHAALFGALSLAVFVVVYASLANHLRQQTDDELLDTAREFRSLYEAEGREALRLEFQREARSQGTESVFFRLLSRDGEVLAASDQQRWKGLAGPGSRRDSPPGTQPIYATVTLPGHRHEVRILDQPAADGARIEIGRTLRDQDLIMKRYRETFEAALAAMLAVGTLVGWVLARRAMSGVRRVTRAAKRIGVGDLGQRVPSGNEGEEIAVLVRAFNEMLEYIETLVRELREVTDNVAHDLRGPLTRIRGLAEATLLRDKQQGAYREAADAVIEESDRLVEMIHTMLEISRADAGLAVLKRVPIDLRTVVTEAAALFQVLAEDKNLAVGIDVPHEPVVVSADVARVQRVVANLIDNAIKYTPRGGQVTATLETHRGQALLSVADTGGGIAPADLQNVFKRFYRGDKSRSTPGNGLGLSLARALTRAHGGDVSLKNLPDRGCLVQVSLPLAPPPPPPPG